VRDLVRRLTQWQYFSRLYLVPFGEIQREVVLSVSPMARVVVYRRLMVRIAQALARQSGALALVTGESLGQVASQTLHNLARIDEVAVLPVLRPLIGMDKIEITDQARRLETLEISNEPDADCCTLFVPAHPGTRLSQHEYEVGVFYYRQRWYPGAIDRLKGLLKVDPGYSGRDGAYFYLGESLVKVRLGAEALPYYEKLIAEFETSQYLEQAKQRRDELAAQLDIKQPPKAGATPGAASAPATTSSPPSRSSTRSRMPRARIRSRCGSS